MLLTDGDCIDGLDIDRVDSDAASVAASEGINLFDHIIPLARSRVVSMLQSKFQGFVNASLGGGPGLSANHIATVMDTGVGRDVAAPRIDMAQVVVNYGNEKGWRTLEQILAYQTLFELYRSAHSRKINDTYQNRMNMAEQELKRCLRWIQQNGVPVADLPLTRPAAKYEESGTWDNSNVSTSTVPATTGGQFYVKISYVVGTVESALSEPVLIDVAAGKAISVSIASLVHPTGQVKVDGVWYPRLVPTGWHIYCASFTSRTYYRQTSSPVAIGTASYTFTADPVFSGVQAALGQKPDRNVLPMEFLNRA
jgi:hypothetical protein